MQSGNPMKCLVPLCLILLSSTATAQPLDCDAIKRTNIPFEAEEVNGKAFVDLNDARRRIDSFIADVYNKERLHSALGYQSPLGNRVRAKQTTVTHRGNRHCHRNYRVSLKGCSPALSLQLPQADARMQGHHRMIRQAMVGTLALCPPYETGLLRRWAPRNDAGVA